jgi:hypothetical protein
MSERNDGGGGGEMRNEEVKDDDDEEGRLFTGEESDPASTLQGLELHNTKLGHRLAVLGVATSVVLVEVVGLELKRTHRDACGCLPPPAQFDSTRCVPQPPQGPSGRTGHALASKVLLRPFRFVVVALCN